ncbi:hypothetical protein [Peribacillus saganii]|nr:hypothetical protein [Peribacillus saganii]
MKVCEICGSKEEMEVAEEETYSRKLIHICETCRDDRILSFE